VLHQPELLERNPADRGGLAGGPQQLSGDLGETWPTAIPEDRSYESCAATKLGSREDQAGGTSPGGKRM
jgi:hypothetical protein